MSFKKIKIYIICYLVCFIEKYKYSLLEYEMQNIYI